MGGSSAARRRTTRRARRRGTRRGRRSSSPSGGRTRSAARSLCPSSSAPTDAQDSPGPILNRWHWHRCGSPRAPKTAWMSSQLASLAGTIVSSGVDGAALMPETVVGGKGQVSRRAPRGRVPHDAKEATWQTCCSSTMHRVRPQGSTHSPTTCDRRVTRSTPPTSSTAARSARSTRASRTSVRRAASARRSSGVSARPTDLPNELVYGGFSLGVLPAQKLAQTRAGARGALLFYSAVPTSEFGSSWPAEVPVQVHGMDADPFFVDEGDIEAAREIVESADGRRALPLSGRPALLRRQQPAELRRRRDEAADRASARVSRARGLMRSPEVARAYGMIGRRCDRWPRRPPSTTARWVAGG